MRGSERSENHGSSGSGATREQSESIGVPVGDTPEEVVDHVEDIL
nr:hypothetical protein [Halomicrobium katesii]